MICQKLQTDKIDQEQKKSQMERAFLLDDCSIKVLEIV